VAHRLLSLGRGRVLPHLLREEWPADEPHHPNEAIWSVSMEVFDFAMKMELEGKAWYERRAQLTEHPGLRRILQEMAEDEGRHYETFKALKEGRGGTGSTEETQVLGSVKSFFEELVDKGAPQFPEHDLAAWKELRETEAKAEKFYREKADEATDEDSRQALELIADEERKHHLLIDNMIEFLTTPDAWLENAEWRQVKTG
jgi:rubrerythrin